MPKRDEPKLFAAAPLPVSPLDDEERLACLRLMPSLLLNTLIASAGRPSVNSVAGSGGSGLKRGSALIAARNPGHMPAAFLQTGGDSCPLHPTRPRPR